MRIIVYVEGRSDKLALEALLRPLIERKSDEGISIQFFEAPSGDKKESILFKVPLRAVNIILNDPSAIVIAMPDLYPKNKGFAHETVNELKYGVTTKFRSELISKCGDTAGHLENRFKVFCFKHDLEALVLASNDALKDRLGVDWLEPIWITPVEDQNHDNPPKRIVEELFRKCGKHYKSSIDAPVILSLVDYRDIANLCDQNFKPFVKFLTEATEELCHRG